VAFRLPWERTCAPIRCADQAKWRVLPYSQCDQRILAISRFARWVALLPAEPGELSPGQGIASLGIGASRLVLVFQHTRLSPMDQAATVTMRLPGTVTCDF
jgi:hypothetical protein